MNARAQAPQGEAPSPAPGLSGAQYSRLRALIHRESGIWLGETKKSLVVARLARHLRELGLGWSEYCQAAEDDRTGEVLTPLLDRISTNETHFFREPAHFRLLSERVLPDWRAQMEAGTRPRQVKVWSAACSTGEEPYSLAMVLLDAFGPPAAPAEVAVLASDLSTRVLARAADAIWPVEKEKEIPETQRRRYMLRGVATQAGRIRAGPELRRIVQFRRLNLVLDAPPEVAPFDLIFCRNVLIYFDAPTRARVLERLVSVLAPGGYLFLGHAEVLGAPSIPMEAVMPTVYRRPLPRAR